MFVGRYQELVQIERSLFQAKHENPQHFLILGERGIGKSSLLLYVSSLASGKLTGLETEKFNFLIVNSDLGGCVNQLEIIQKIARCFRQTLNDHDKIKNSAKELWDWITNWEVLGVKFSKENPDADPDLIASEFVDGLVTVFLRNPEMDGVLILIDESDRPPEDANLGETLKMFSERLERRNCSKVIFGMAGLPSVIGKLRASHDSSPRLFHTMNLKPLEISERKKVIEIGLELANEKNSDKTTINTRALNYICELSEGYPNFVQQFSYSAFDNDHDNEITEEDVAGGAYKENGALDQLGDKYFNEMYHARISAESYRRVLDAMANHSDEWISRKTIIEESETSQTNVDNALKSLKLNQIIMHDEAQRGIYKLPTKSFAAWINAIRAKRSDN